MKPMVVVSFYDRRSLVPLQELLQSLSKCEAGCEYELLLVVNSTGDMRLPEHLVALSDNVIYRPNVGMNIGAWHGGWEAFSGRPFYLFLQDECFAVRDGWLALFAEKLERGSGLVGESVNNAWDKSWLELRETVGLDVLPEHVLDGKAANRVDVYLDFMRRHCIDPGPNGRHLRSLVWAIKGSLLARMGGFPQGANYGECIAAEIGVSRHVESLGETVDQLDYLPFHAIRHREWNQDAPGGRWSHKPIWLTENMRLKEQVEELQARVSRHSRTETWWKRLWSSGIGP